MISLSSTLTFDSQLLPGARVQLRKFNVERRAAVTLRLASYRAAISDVYRRMLDSIPVIDETDETGKVTRAGDPPDVRQAKAIQRAILQGEIAALEDAHVKPEVLRAYVVSVDGVEIDGEPLTPETLVTKAPPQFADEIYSYLEANNGLPPFDASSSPSPSHSPTAADGNSPTSTAIAAES